jgi:hypothetical protein
MPENFIAIHRNAWIVQNAYKTSRINFETLPRPSAAYAPNGKIIRASKNFRELAGITEEDIEQDEKNIFDLLSGENAGVLEAARDVFCGTYDEKLRLTPACPFRYKTEAAKIQSEKYVGAVFFPMIYEKADVGGVMLLDAPLESWYYGLHKE